MKLVLMVVGLVVGASVFSRCDWRSVRRQVASELEALEVIEGVAGEALRHGSIRLQEQQAGSHLWFELAPENPHVCSVSVEVDTRAIWLWAGDRGCRLAASTAVEPLPRRDDLPVAVDTTCRTIATPARR